MPVGVRLSLSPSVCAPILDVAAAGEVKGGLGCMTQQPGMHCRRCSMFEFRRDKPASTEIETQLAMALGKAVSLSLSVPLPACLSYLLSLSLFLFSSCVSIVDAHANFVSVVSVGVVVAVDVGFKDRTCLALPRARLGLPNRTHTYTSTLYSAPAHGFLFRIVSTKQKTKMTRTASSAAYRSASTRRAKLAALDKRERERE